MKNNRLTRLLTILDNTEKRKLRQLVETSGKEKALLLLYDYLIRYSNSPNRLDKELVFKTVYPADKVFNGRKLSDLNTQLYHLTEDFFIAQYIKQKNRLTQRRLLMLEGLNEKALSDDRYIDHSNHLTKRTINDLQNSLERTDVQDLSYYLNQYQMYAHSYYFETNKWGHNGRHHLEALTDNLDTFYCLAKLRYANELYMRRRILNEDSPVLLADNIYEHGKLLSKKGVYLAEIYLLSLDLMKEFDEKKFRRLKTQTFDYADKLEKTELSNILTFIINHAAHFTRRGEADLATDNYEIHKLGLEKEVFVEKGFITPILLINYALLSSIVGKTAEIPAVLSQYQNKIKASEKEATIILCQAYQHFGEGNFYEAYQLVENHPRGPISQGLHQKPLKLQCLYELENSSLRTDMQQTLYDACIVYRRYLQRKSNELSSSTYTANLNFVNILLKLTHPDIDKTELLEMTVDSTIHKSWLIEKIKTKK